MLCEVQILDIFETNIIFIMVLKVLLPDVRCCITNDDLSWIQIIVIIGKVSQFSPYILRAMH